jgi:hypothetical protein
MSASLDPMENTYPHVMRRYEMTNLILFIQKYHPEITVVDYTMDEQTGMVDGITTSTEDGYPADYAEYILHTWEAIENGLCEHCHDMPACRNMHYTVNNIMAGLCHACAEANL